MPGRQEPHDYRLCEDDYCQQFTCRIYKEGFEAGYGAGYGAGEAAGYAAGYSDGYEAGSASAP